MAVLPLFPLNVALFPGAFLPLHIFEPRYRRLLADQVEAAHRFAIVPAGSDGGPPALGALGTIARIRAVQPLADGRSNIVVSGEGRIAIAAILPTELPYLLAECEPHPDRGDAEVPSLDVGRLRDLGEQFAELLAVLERGEGEREWSDDPAILSFQIAALIDWDFPVQQRFLAIRSSAERVTRLLGALPGLITSASGSARVHQRAVYNGTGQR